jgi:DNA-binding SARP family transcriptional activator/predicted ATPase
MLKLYFLGSPRIQRNGRLTEADTRKATALLAYLALTGEPQTRDTLAALLWPDFDDSRAKAALRRTLSALKSSIGAEPLLISRDRLGLQMDAIWCDVLQFQQLLANGSDVTALETAVTDLYRDDFLTGFSLRDSLPFDEWQLQQAQHLQRELSRALEQLIGYYQTQGQYENAIDHAHRWLQLDLLHEEAHRQLMQLYAWSGQRSAALQQYRDCVRILEEELGVPPLAETTQLYQAIQEERLEQPSLPPASQPVIPPAPPPPIPLIGRQQELQTLNRWYKQVGPDGRFMVISGEMGIGKTRLAEQFQHELGPAVTLHARCYQGETRLAYAPFIQAMRQALHQPEAQEKLQNVAAPWLAEANRLLPELVEWFPQLPGAPPLVWPGTPGRFLEGLSQVLLALLTGRSPGLLWLDDGQWADTASLDLLAFLARRWQGRPYLILVFWRGGDLPADHSLHQLLAEARRDGIGTEIHLTRLSADDVKELVAATTATPPASAWITRLFQESEGLPFLITAYLEAHFTANQHTSDQWDLPATARDLFLARLRQTSETARQLLQTAAVIDRAFDFDLLQVASGRSEEESLLALEELVVKNLLLEHAGDTPYDYNHHKLRELIYNEMSLVRRRLLHRRLAHTLTARHKNQAAFSGQIAAHYEQAGLQTEAAYLYQQAPNYARSLFAHREALTHYQSALALGHPQTAALHQACGDSHLRLGAYTAALASYERAAALGSASELPHLEQKIGQVHYRRGEWGLAERHFEQAAALWEETADPSDLARLYIDWSTTATRAGDDDKAQQYALKAQSHAHDPLTQAYTYNILGILTRHRGGLTSATAYFEQSYDLAKTHDFLAVQITALNNLALVETAVANPQAAHAYLQTALKHCLTYGDRHWEAALRNNLADTLHQLGDEEEAMNQLKTAVAIYAEIGKETGQWQPEIWKLMEW